jgi:hypothetical protein
MKDFKEAAEKHIQKYAGEITGSVFTIARSDIYNLREESFTEGCQHGYAEAMKEQREFESNAIKDLVWKLDRIWAHVPSEGGELPWTQSKAREESRTAINEFCQQKSTLQWISIEKERPQTSSFFSFEGAQFEVLVRTASGKRAVTTFISGGTPMIGNELVTHWMPLP